MKTEPCRSCKAPVIWVRTTKGKMMPLNAEPDPNGSFAIIDGVAEPARLFDQTRYTSYFATCPQAKQWRKAK